MFAAPCVIESGSKGEQPIFVMCRNLDMIAKNADEYERIDRRAHACGSLISQRWIKAISAGFR
jgi:hypothetical protein